MLDIASEYLQIKLIPYLMSDDIDGCLQIQSINNKQQENFVELDNAMSFDGNLQPRQLTVQQTRWTKHTFS